MKTQDQFLAEAAALLDRCGIPYMVTGSYASSVHGEPRMTLDADIVIDPPNRGSFARLLSALERDDCYVPRDTALAALRDRRMFNVIDYETSFKLDFILAKDTPFDRERFARRQPAELAGGRMWVTSPEDIVLGKILWARQGGGSERQHRDAAGVVAKQGDALDRAYLHRWADELGVRAELDGVLAAADAIG